MFNRKIANSIVPNQESLCLTNNPALECRRLFSPSHGTGVEHHHGRRGSPAAPVVKRGGSVQGCRGRGGVKESARRPTTSIAIDQPWCATSSHGFCHAGLGENVNVAPSLLLAHETCPKVHGCWTSRTSRTRRRCCTHHGWRGRRCTSVLLTLCCVLPSACRLVEHYRRFRVVRKVNLQSEIRIAIDLEVEHFSPDSWV